MSTDIAALMTPVKVVWLTQGQHTLVSPEDFTNLSSVKWCARRMRSTRFFYAMRTTTKHRTELMHHRVSGYPEVDHINGNTLDNRRENLRNGEHRNPQNSRMQVNNTSGYTGVVWRKDNQNWSARITVRDKSIHIGTYQDPVKAAHARDDAARRFHGEFARLNFPKEGERGVKLCASQC